MLMQHGSGQKKCPCCRTPFDGRLEVPQIEADAKAWFKVVDFDGNGRLEQGEVLDILKATAKIDVDRLEQDLPRMFANFDPNNDGTIEYGELVGPHGLFYHIRQMCRKSESAQQFIPDINRNKEAWFRYWDEDGSGSLSREEILRSLVKTFKLSPDLQTVQGLRSSMNALWHLFDDDGNGEIDMREFCKKDVGLGDTLILNLKLK